MDRSYLASLWFMSRDPADWRRIEKVRNSDTTDWRAIVDMHNKMDAGHDAPWLRFLAGEFPEYPERILASALGQVTARMDKIRQNIMLMDTDPASWKKLDPVQVDLTQVSEHHWQSVNPVTTEALIQLMLGAPQIQYNGGLLHASTRYFDPVRRRPGLPPDVAALVTQIDAEAVKLDLVNLSPFESRDVLIQAGTFAEHRWTKVKYQRRIDRVKGNMEVEGENQSNRESGEESREVNGKFLRVRLPPGRGITLHLGMKRFANWPTYAFPWHGGKIPVQ
jgi:hypothetical protein